MTALLAAAALQLAGCAYSIVRDGALREQSFDDVASRTARAWGGPLPPLEAEVVSSDQVPELLRSIVADERTPEQLERYQQAIRTAGLWPAGRDLVDEWVAVGEAEFAGVYVPGRRRLYVVQDARRPLALRVASALTGRDLFMEVVLAHELVHGLQHEAYPQLLEQGPAWYDQDDLALAAQAAFEGDATRYGFEAVLDGAALPPADALRRELEADAASREDGPLATAPALLQLTLAFPYAYGYGLSLGEGRELLAAPPASTEQVLHPGERRAPFEVRSLAGLAAALPPGCDAVGENTLGELGISVLLRDLGGADAPVAWADASSGWDGDRFLAARCGDTPELVWWTAWDSQTDALEFATAYESLAPAVAERAGMPRPPSLRVDGRQVTVWSAGLAGLASPAALEALSRSGRVDGVEALLAFFADEASAPAE